MPRSRPGESAASGAPRHDHRTTGRADRPRGDRTETGGPSAMTTTTQAWSGRVTDRLPAFAFLAPFAALVLVQQVLFPAPFGVVLNGALVGGRVALIALGIALVYRANRIVNFAQGDLGAVPASLAVMLVLSWGLNYWLGFVIGLAAALLLGLLVETLIIARFFRAPRLVLTVATIGIAQLLTGAGLLLPRAFGETSFGDRMRQPFSADFEVGGTIFNATDIFTMIVVPVAFVALALSLRRSSFGIAIVGSAERADRAASLGIPVRRLHTVVWVIASVLAYLAMFLRAGTVGLPIGEVLAPTFLVQRLRAAVFGRFEQLTTIAAAAIGLGIVDQAMTFQDGNKPGYNDAVLFVIVLVGLLVTRRGGGGRVDADSSSTWQAARETRPIPREMVGLPEVRAARVAIWAVLAVAVLTLPLWLSNSRIDRGTLLWSIEMTNETRFFYVSLAFLGLALLMVNGVRRSRTGRVLVAIRENEKAARSYGINATRTTLAAFALSGFLAAGAGALYVHQQQGLAVEPFLTQRSLDLFSMVVIGGLGSLPGALLGAVYVRGADFFLPLDWQFLATGAGLLLVLLLLPSRLGGLLADLRDGALRRIATRRGLVVPSLLADVRVEDPHEDRSLAEAVDAAKASDRASAPPGGLVTATRPATNGADGADLADAASPDEGRPTGSPGPTEPGPGTEAEEVTR